MSDPATDDTPVSLPIPDVPASLDAELARPAGPEIMIATRPDGVVAIQGPPTAVEAFTARMERVLGSPKLAQATQYVSMAGSGLDAIPGVGEDAAPRMFKFSGRAMDLLRDNGMVNTSDGVFTTAVDATSGGPGLVPDWLPVPSGADMIQLQTAAVGLALHASIKSLSDAVERVEDRVDEIRDLVRSGQVGEVLGHHRVIAERLAMVRSPNSRGLGETDWAAVAHLHPHIVSGLERTRFFIRSRMGLTEPGRTVRGRVDAAQKLVDANLSDALGLLATCEHNLAGWQRLRLDRVVRTEPAHLDSVLIDMESSLALHRSEDQALVDDLAAMMDALMEPTGLEGLALLQRRKLIRHVEEIHAVTVTFARQRDLTMPHMRHADLPTFRDSTALIADRTRDGSKWAFDKVRTGGRALPVVGRRRRRLEQRPPAPPEPDTRLPD